MAICVEGRSYRDLIVTIQCDSRGRESNDMRLLVVPRGTHMVRDERHFDEVRFRMQLREQR